MDPQVIPSFCWWWKQATLLHPRRLAFSRLTIVIILLGAVALEEDACCPQDPLRSLLVVITSIIREASTKSDVGGNIRRTEVLAAVEYIKDMSFYCLLYPCLTCLFGL